MTEHKHRWRDVYVKIEWQLFHVEECECGAIRRIIEPETIADNWTYVYTPPKDDNND